MKYVILLGFISVLLIIILSTDASKVSKRNRDKRAVPLPKFDFRAHMKKRRLQAARAAVIKRQRELAAAKAPTTTPKPTISRRERRRQILERNRKKILAQKKRQAELKQKQDAQRIQTERNNQREMQRLLDRKKAEADKLRAELARMKAQQQELEKLRALENKRLAELEQAQKLAKQNAVNKPKLNTQPKTTDINLGGLPNIDWGEPLSPINVDTSESNSNIDLGVPLSNNNVDTAGFDWGEPATADTGTGSFDFGVPATSGNTDEPMFGTGLGMKPVAPEDITISKKIDTGNSRTSGSIPPPVVKKTPTPTNTEFQLTNGETMFFPTQMARESTNTNTNTDTQPPTTFTHNSLFAGLRRRRKNRKQG